MAFKEFQRKRTHGGDPAVSITKGGMFVINGSCIASYLPNAKYVKLYWDVEARKVGIKPMKTKDQYTYSLNLSGAGVVGAVSGTAFLKTCGIKHEETKSFPANWNEKEGLVEFKVS